MIELLRQQKYSQDGNDTFGMVKSLPIMPRSLISENGEVNYSEIFRDDFSDKITEILGTPKYDDSCNNKITITCHKYHAGVLEYLVHDNQDSNSISNSQLKTDNPLLVAKYINMNKDLLQFAT